MDFVVTKSRWGRGKTGGSLRNKDNKMCCLGFVCRQLDIPAKRLLNVAVPYHIIDNCVLDSQRNKLGEKLGILLKKQKAKNYDASDKENPSYHYKDKAFVLSAAEINDDTNINDEERIKQLTKVFKKAGHTITFV